MWPKVPLKNLFNVRSSKRVLKAQWKRSGIPFYRGREITALSKNGFVSNELYISEDLYEQFKTITGVPSAGDIMVTAIGTIGNSYVVKNNDQFYFKDASVLWLEKISEVDSNYINWWLSSSNMQEQLEAGNGATVDTLTIQKLQSIVVDLPPLEEQKRVVAILDQAFSDIDKARATAEKNLENAKEIFDSYLQETFGEVNERWLEKRLCELFKIGSSKRIYESDWTKSGVPFYGGKEVVSLATTGKAISNAYISEEKYAEYCAKYDMPKSGDILMTARGTIGVGYIVQNGDKFYYKDGNIILFRPIGETNPSFLLYAFHTKHVLDQLQALFPKSVELKR